MLTYAVLVFAVLLVLFPIYWMIVTSLKLPREIYRMPSLWPHALTLNNYHVLIADKGFLLAVRNSFLVADVGHGDLGDHLVLRRLFAGPLPLPLPRAGRAG